MGCPNVNWLSGHNVKKFLLGEVGEDGVRQTGYEVVLETDFLEHGALYLGGQLRESVVAQHQHLQSGTPTQQPETTPEH